MKTNLILASTVLVCGSLSFAAGTSGTSRSYGTSNPTIQGGTSSHPAQDGSKAVYDQTINPNTIDADRSTTHRSRQDRISTDTSQSNERGTKDTDRSGHKSDQAPTTRE